MKLAGDDDAILLSSGTQPAPGFISRLRATAYSDPLVGTVTAATYNGTIASVSDFADLRRSWPPHVHQARGASPFPTTTPA